MGERHIVINNVKCLLGVHIFIVKWSYPSGVQGLLPLLPLLRLGLLLHTLRLKNLFY